MVVLLFDSRRLENKTGRSGLRSSSRERNADSCTSIWREIRDGEVVVIKTLFFLISAGTLLLVYKKNIPAEAPGCRDSASRLSCTGKPATKAGRFTLLAISGAPVLGSMGT